MDSYHGGFFKIDEKKVSDFDGVAVHLRHKSGLEVVRMECDDKENLFAFVFRTPAMDDKGLAHIMEHSVLCGSKKYPLKEPFVNLMNESVNTFLNAMTYPDMTAYPAASTNVKDYYNLMAVYGDAVFFPTLTENAFMQEAHRLELDENGDASIQGVVYNEMKGAYSSFVSVASDVQMAAMMEGTCYAHNSGGDPLDVARITYKEFLSFHKKYYRADNCLLVLYGNEDTKKQLDFVQKEFLDRLEEKETGDRVQQGSTCSYGMKDSGQETADRGENEGKDYIKEEKVSLDEMARMMRSAAGKGHRTVRAAGPNGDTEGAAVTMSWRVAGGVSLGGPRVGSVSRGDSQVPQGGLSRDSAESSNGGSEKPYTLRDIVSSSFLMQLLIGHDASPMNKALNESALGDRLYCGINSSTSDYMLYFGLGGVDEGNEEKVKCLIEETLQKVKQTGFTADDIDAAILAIDFAMREKMRLDGPFSLVWMEKVASAWVYGGKPLEILGRREAFDAFLKEANLQRARDERDAKAASIFCVSLMDKMLIQNKDSAYVVVTPKESYMEDRNKKEKELTRAQLEKADKDALKKRLGELHAFQEHKETAQETSCIPSLGIDDLSSDIEAIKTDVSSVGGIPIITSCAPSNGIVYMRMLLPIDALQVEDLPYLNLLSTAAFATGAGGKKWDEVLRELTLCTGGIAATPMTSTVYDSVSSKAYFESVKQYRFIGRDWMSFAFKTPIEEVQRALALFTSYLPRLDFADEDRLKTLIAQEYDDIRSSIIPCGSRMAAMRSRCRLSHEAALDEVWNGLAQLFTMRRINSTPVLDTGRHLALIMQKMLDSGTLIHVTADEKSMQKVLGLLNGANSPIANFRPLAPRREADDAMLYGLTLLPGEGGDALDAKGYGKSVAYKIKSQVGFAAVCYQADKVDYVSDASAQALCRYLGSNTLWEAIRTKGGAYGANAGLNSRNSVVTLSTYRDPKPYRSLDVLKECIASLAQKHFSREEVEHLITGCYSNFVEPMSPYQYGAEGLLKALYGITNEDRKQSVQALLELNDEKLHNEAVCLQNAMQRGCASSVMSSAAMMLSKTNMADSGAGCVIDLGL